MWRQCALEYSRLLIRAKLDFGDILQWNFLESNDFIQMGIVFGDQIEFRRQYQNGVDFRFIWITCAAKEKISFNFGIVWATAESILRWISIDESPCANG